MNNLSIKEMLRLPSIKNINVNKPITNPVIDYIDEELINTIKDIKNNIKEEKKQIKLIPTHLKSEPFKEVTINYKKWWRKEDVKELYKGLIKYGYNIPLLEYHLNYKWSQKQIRLRLKYEYKVRPKTIEKAMLRQNIN